LLNSGQHSLFLLLSLTHTRSLKHKLSLSLSLSPPSLSLSLSHTHTDCVSLVRHRHTLKHSLTHKHTLFHSQNTHTQNTHSLSLVVKRRCCVGVVPLKIFGFLFFLKNWWSKKKKNIDDLRAFFHKSATQKKQNWEQHLKKGLEHKFVRNSLFVLLFFFGGKKH